jgi:hypothetical protein
MKELQITHETYSGAHYILAKWGGDVIGSCVETNGQFLVTGKRKPQSNIDAAVRQMIEHRISDHVNKADRWRRRLRHLIEKQA